MYNRYVPQSDGTFHRSRVPEPESSPTAPPRILSSPEPPTESSSPEKQPEPIKVSTPRLNNRMPRKEAPLDLSGRNLSSFLWQLLPQNFDTEDMIVVLLLLLMSGGNNEDSASAMLTLALYLFL